MRLLLDTCALLWFVDDAERLSPRARQLLDDETHEVFVSVASLWVTSDAFFSDYDVPIAW